jgi:hypothetical protein
VIHIVIRIVMTNRAATASKSAIFIAPTHVAVQRVIHEVNTFKFGEFHGRDYKYAHYHGGQWKKRQQHDGHQTKTK